MKLGQETKNTRGFRLVKFTDKYGARCSLQQSSLAESEKPGTSAIWLGIDDPEPKVIHHQAAGLGVETTATEGWVPYPIPAEVLLTTRMHLDREQVEALIIHLKSWLKTGRFA